MRSISEVASAVTKGDLTQMIRVEAKGEVEELKDTINQMIANLKGTTTLREPGTGLAEIQPCQASRRCCRDRRDLNTVTRRILSELAQVVNAQKGVFYMPGAGR